MTTPTPESGAPRFSMPPDACDAHCHLFGPVDRFPFSPERPYTPPNAGLELYEQLRHRIGWSRAVFVQPACHGTDHAAILDALRRRPDAYRGVALLDADTPKTVIGDLDQAGFRGMRFNFVSHLGASTDPETMLSLARRAADYGWHVALHFAPTDLVALAPRLRELPCPYIIDHFGRMETRHGLDQPAFLTLMRLLEDDRCWVKISAANRVSDEGAPYDDVFPYARAIVAAAPDRTLWGSDWPHPNVKSQPDTADLVTFLFDAVDDEAVRRRILVDNPSLLYRFDTAPQ